MSSTIEITKICEHCGATFIGICLHDDALTGF